MYMIKCPASVAIINRGPLAVRSERFWGWVLPSRKECTKGLQWERGGPIQMLAFAILVI
jgi:hypothetical protein